MNLVTVPIHSIQKTRLLTHTHALLSSQLLNIWKKCVCNLKYMICLDIILKCI